MENNFAYNLKHLRIESGMTQEELGKKVNKDYSTIGKWENGSRSPIMEDVIKISEIFNVSLQELIIEKLTTSSEDNNKNYKKILKEKGLMDEDDNIDEEKFDKVMKIADIMDFKKKE